MSECIALVADDLTGALDAGVQFRNRGQPVVVSIEKPLAPNTIWPIHAEGVAGITTDSRSDPTPLAAEKLKWVGRQVAGWKLFKKIDSTLRGNLGAELEALLESHGAAMVILAPAFPDQGRTTVDGVQLVNGVPVTEAGFGADPVVPVRDSRISALIVGQCSLITQLVPLRVVDGGADEVAGVLHSCKAPIVVCDAVNNKHLANIAAGACRCGRSYFACGSAGLAWAMAQLSARGDLIEPTLDLRHIPLLMVIGSRHPLTCDQVERLAIPKIPVTAESLVAGDCVQAAEKAALYLSEAGSVVVYIPEGPVLPDSADKIAWQMGNLTRRILTTRADVGIMVTGGDTAGAVCRSLGATALQIEREVLNGIPLSTLVGGAWCGLPVITKAGGFGRPDDLVHLHRWWIGVGQES